MNMLTMLALSLVVGMLVDDAIVEVENNVRHLRMGKPPMQAATDAAIEIGLAVIATSLTLCAVFVPVAFMGGIGGEFFKPFAFTATVAVLFSLLVARTLTPMMASRLMRPEHELERPGRIKNWYVEKVDWVLANRWKTIAASTVLMISGIVLAATLPKEFQPAQDAGMVNLDISLPPGSTMDESRAVVNRSLVERVRAEETVDVVRAQVRHHLRRRHRTDLDVLVRVDPVLRHVVAQQVVVHRIVEGHGELEALPGFGIAPALVLHRERDRLSVDVKHAVDHLDLVARQTDHTLDVIGGRFLWQAENHNVAALRLRCKDAPGENRRRKRQGKVTVAVRKL
jgi:hypothetical protein